MFAILGRMVSFRVVFESHRTIGARTSMPG